MYKEYPRFTADELGEYDRKSRTDDPLLTVEEVLAKHDKILEDFAIKNFGGPIPKEHKFKEIGTSESLSERPEILKLLKFIENPKIKGILIVDVQRLSRGDLEDAGRLIKLLRYTNTYVITPVKIYDLRDEYDRDAFERELKRGNEYLEYTKKILNRGRLASVREGNYIASKAPFGYERVAMKYDNRECHTLVEKKEEADIVRLIFDLYCNHNMGTTMICRKLESMGVKTKNGLSHWKPPVICDILENVHYIGKVRWNWRKTVKIVEDQEIKKLRQKAGANEYLVFDGKHDGIISEELFNRAQEISGTRHRTKTDTTLKNPFSGLIYCKCGYKMGYNTYRQNGKLLGKPRLKCSNQVHCKSGSVFFDEMIDYVCRTLEDCIEDFELRIKNDQSDSIKLHKDLIANLERKLKELETKEVLQWEAQYDPDPDKRLPMEIFKKLNGKLLQEKEEIRKALCKAYEAVPEPIDYENKVLSFSTALEALKDPEVSVEIKNQYLKDIIERIDYERPPVIRITKENEHLYPEDKFNKRRFHNEPWKATITLKS